MILEIFLVLLIAAFYLFVGGVLVEAIRDEISRMKEDKHKPLARLITLFLWPLALCIILSLAFYRYLMEDMLTEWRKK